MKKTIAILLLAAMMLQSCGRDEFITNDINTTDTTQNETEDDRAEETVKAKHPETSVSSYNFNLDNLQMEAQAGIIDTTLRHTADITSFKTDMEVAEFNSAPNVCMDGEYTYMIRIFPEEFRESDQFYEFISEGKYYSEIEVYKDHDYSQIYDTIKLNVPDDKRFICYSLTYNSDDEKFYITAGKILEGETNYSLNLLVFSKNGEFEYSKKISDNTLDDVTAHKGDIYRLKSGRLTRINVETDEEITAAENVSQYFISDGVLYYIKEELNAAYKTEITLYSYDDTANQSQKILVIDTDERIETMAYDAATKTVYFSNFESLCLYRDGEVKVLISTNETFLHVNQIYNGQILVGVGHNQLAVYQIPETPVSLEEKQISLRICGGILSSRVLTTMNATGISVRSEMVYAAENRDEYVNTMAKKLLAGDTDFDIFYIDTEMMTLFKKAYFEDLGKYDGLNKYMDALIPGLKELCVIDDKLALAPINFAVMMTQYNDSLLKSEFEFPVLYNDIWKVTPELTKDAYYIGDTDEVTLLQPWFEQLASNYMAEIIGDDAAKQDLEMLYTDLAEMSGYKSVYLGEEYAKQNRYLKIADYSDIGMYDKENTTYAPLIRLGEEYKYAVYGTFWAVNPASPNKELAVAYLMYYMAWRKGEELLPVKYYFEGADNSQSSYDVFKTQIADSVREYRSNEYYEHVLDRFKEIRDGTITPAQAAEKTLWYLKMIRDE